CQAPECVLLGVAEREGGRREDRADDDADPLAGDAREPVDAEDDDARGEDAAGDDPHCRSACAHARMTIAPRPRYRNAKARAGPQPGTGPRGSSARATR